MIKIVTSWYCTCCGHGQSFNPGTELPPVTCPACGEQSSWLSPPKDDEWGE